MIRCFLCLSAVAACSLLTGCTESDFAKSEKMKCGDQISYTPPESKNAFGLRVTGRCPVKYTVQCSGGNNPVPGVIKPGASALVNCDPGKTVKTADLACEKSHDEKCEFTYEVLDINK